MSAVIAIASRDGLFRAAIGEQLTAAGYTSVEINDTRAAPAALLAVVDADDWDAKLPVPGLGIGVSETGAASYRWYLRKPVRFTALRRLLQSALAALPEEDMHRLPGGWNFYPAERVLRAGNRPGGVELTEKETELLCALLHAHAAIVPRQELLARVWGYSEDSDTHTMETHIYRLRAKLKEAGMEEGCIITTPDGYGINR
ncbi:MAG: winged helix-turn-helix domain-containing protein [Alphaproteobacteria bacterium]|nr:winged helix-turn-helix domain-containing protein [Alphaproteobacteria bacterium]